MLFCGHIYSALKLKELISITDYKDYYLGAILPDIRYLANIDRASTHIPQSLAKSIFKENRDLNIGLQFHLFIDRYLSEYNLNSKIKSNFPRIIQLALSNRFINIFTEIYCLEKLKTMPKIKVGQTWLPKFEDLKISKNELLEYTNIINKILDTLTIEEVEKLISKNSILKSNSKIRIYKFIGKIIINLPILKSYILRKVRPEVENFIISVVNQFKHNL